MIIDIATNILMQSIETPILIIFSKIIAYALDPVVLVIISLILSTYLYFKISKKQGIFFATTILIAGILIKVLKEIFQRARPLNALITESSFSMPSGHATMAIVFFGLIIYLFTTKKNKLIPLISATLITLLIGFTRIYLRVHWLTDVLAGFILGKIVGRLLKKFLNEFKDFSSFYFFMPLISGSSITGSLTPSINNFTMRLGE